MNVALLFFLVSISLFCFFYLLRFEINFQTPQSSDDIAFSINPQIVRFLVLSSLRKGSWDSKDFASDKEAAFNMVIVIKLEGYEVGFLNYYANDQINKPK